MFSKIIKYTTTLGGGGSNKHSVQELKDAKSLQSSDNLIIKGENLLVLSKLIPFFKNKIKCIYIDPPYNTGNCNFDYKDSLESEAYLSCIKKRLILARELLKDDGVIFVQCDDNEMAEIKVLMDKIMGRKNFVSNIVYLKGNAQNNAKTIQKNQEYILTYAKDIKMHPIKKLLQEKIVKVYKDEATNRFYYEGASLTMGGGEAGELTKRPNLGYTFYFNPQTKDIKPVMDYDKTLLISNKHDIYKEDKELILKGYIPIRPTKMGSSFGRWKWSIEKAKAELDRILIKKNKNGYTVLCKEWVAKDDVKKKSDKNFYACIKKPLAPKSIIDFVGSGVGTIENKALFNAKTFSLPKPEKLIWHIINISTEKRDIVLDFYLGSGTTCAVAHKMGRQYIGIEKEDYIKTVAVSRLIKVLEGEQGGISRIVGWKGSGSFIYCEIDDEKIVDKL